MCNVNNNYKTFNLLYAGFMYTELWLTYMDFIASTLNLEHILEENVKSTNSCG
jgi:hypothetical protein